MLPQPIADFRKTICRNCDCNVDFLDPCATCPHKRWGTALCRKREENLTIHIDTNPEPIDGNNLPSISEMAGSLVKSAAKWAMGGLRHTSEEVLRHRLETCQSCEFWKAEAFNNTGRCMKCGCSTWAKIRMATERCPIGKWETEPKQ